MAVSKRVFRAVDFVGLAAYWAASVAAAWVIGSDGLAIWLRAGAALGLWAAALAIPLWIALDSRRRLDEMQQLILWRMLAIGGLFALGYMIFMSAYFTLTSENSGGAAVSLLALVAMAPPLAMLFAAVMTAFTEWSAGRPQV